MQSWVQLGQLEAVRTSSGAGRWRAAVRARRAEGRQGVAAVGQALTCRASASSSARPGPSLSIEPYAVRSPGPKVHYRDSVTYPDIQSTANGTARSASARPVTLGSWQSWAG